jgi:hypothetical protein
MWATSRNPSATLDNIFEPLNQSDEQETMAL